MRLRRSIAALATASALVTGGGLTACGSAAETDSGQTVEEDGGGDGQTDDSDDEQDDEQDDSDDDQDG